MIKSKLIIYELCFKTRDILVRVAGEGLGLPQHTCTGERTPECSVLSPTTGVVLEIKPVVRLGGRCLHLSHLSRQKWVMFVCLFI